jgi:hypothetical protein
MSFLKTFIFGGNLGIFWAFFGERQEGESKMLYSTTFHPLHQLRQKWPQVEIRGSAQVHCTH